MAEEIKQAGCRQMASDEKTVKIEDPSDSEDTVDEEDDDKVLSHQDAMQLFKDSLAEIIVGDPMLSDLHTAVTLEEVKSYIALEHGQAITVNVKRADNIVLPIVVLQNSTVLELKKAIQRHIVLKQARENHTTHINWRHIWKRHWLYFNGQKLTEDRKLIKDYGVANKDEVTFIRRLRQR